MDNKSTYTAQILVREFLKFIKFNKKIYVNKFFLITSSRHEITILKLIKIYIRIKN